MKEYDIKITEVLEKTVQVQADSREEAEAIASENWNNSLYDMDSAEDFADVSFHAGESREIEAPELLDVLLVSPGEHPKMVRIGAELEDLQRAVGGNIECVYPFDEMVGLIVNEEGKFNGSSLNRALYSEEGKLVDVIAGDFLVVGLTGIVKIPVGFCRAGVRTVEDPSDSFPYHGLEQTKPFLHKNKMASLCIPGSGRIPAGL